jgi:hypothetical protein
MSSDQAPFQYQSHHNYQDAIISGKKFTQKYTTVLEKEALTRQKLSKYI